MIEFVALRITYFTVNTTNIMEEWKAELETFYETEGTKKVTKELNIKSAVLKFRNRQNRNDEIRIFSFREKRV